MSDQGRAFDRPAGPVRRRSPRGGKSLQRLLLYLGEAAQGVEQDAPDRQAEPDRDQAVTQFVDQHRQVQQDNESHRDQVPRH